MFITPNGTSEEGMIGMVMNEDVALLDDLMQ